MGYAHKAGNSGKFTVTTEEIILPNEVCSKVWFSAPKKNKGQVYIRFRESGPPGCGVELDKGVIFGPLCVAARWRYGCSWNH